MKHLVVYVSDDTKTAVKDIINNPHSPYETYADFYRKAIDKYIKENNKYMTTIMRPRVSTVIYSKPLTKGDVIDIFLRMEHRRCINVRDICKKTRISHRKHKSRVLRRMRELVNMGVLFKEGPLAVHVEDKNGVSHKYMINHYSLNYSNKYVILRIKQLKEEL